MPLLLTDRKHVTVQPRDREPHREPEIREMAHLLEIRHGLYAAEIAGFFQTANVLGGDPERADRWAAVAHRIRLRQRLRQLDLT